MFDIYLVYRCMNEKLSNHTFCVEMDIYIQRYENMGTKRDLRCSKWDSGKQGKVTDFRLRKKEQGNRRQREGSGCWGNEVETREPLKFNYTGEFFIRPSLVLILEAFCICKYVIKHVLYTIILHINFCISIVNSSRFL